MNCKNCHQEVEQGCIVCPHCQSPMSPTGADGNNPYAAPGVESQTPNYGGSHSAVHEGDATGGVIPYKNPKALIAYYLGILSGLPLIGFPLGIAAFVLGILGLRDRKRNPVIKGSIHAGIGIGCGGLFAVLWGLALVAMLVAAFQA